MKISLATNFDNKLIEEIKDIKEVEELYGRMKYDLVGGGRPIDYVIDMDKQTFENHVKKARAAGLNFNYLINAACTNNFEQNPKWRDEFREFLKYLKSVGVNALTISNPLLLQLVKKYFGDEFKTRISTFAYVDGVGKAEKWQELGADLICLDFGRMNRDFKELEHMASKLTKTKIEIYSNNFCLKDCPMINEHANAIAHSSTIANYVDYPLMYCQRKLLEYPVEYIRSPFVRPEDVVEYERIGIDNFKIIDRSCPTVELVNRVKAYASRNFDGNLLEICQASGFTTSPVLRRDKEHETPVQSIYNDIREIRGLGCKRIEPYHVHIDNKKLSNFIDYFKDGKCKRHCKSCGYCQSIAKEVITVNEDVRTKLLNKYDDLDKEFCS